MTRAFFIHTIPSRSLLSQSFLSVKTLGLVKHGKRVREEIEGGVKEDYWWGRKVIHLGNSSICPFLFTIHCHWCSTSILPSFHSLNHLSTSKPLFPGLVRDRWVGREDTARNDREVIERLLCPYLCRSLSLPPSLLSIASSLITYKPTKIKWG